MEVHQVVAMKEVVYHKEITWDHFCFQFLVNYLPSAANSAGITCTDDAVSTCCKTNQFKLIWIIIMYSVFSLCTITFKGSSYCIINSDSDAQQCGHLHQKTNLDSSKHWNRKIVLQLLMAPSSDFNTSIQKNRNKRTKPQTERQKTDQSPSRDRRPPKSQYFI